MDTQTTPSGLPYLAYLSGLNLGQGGMSGALDPALAGGGAQPAGPGGMTGGLSLAELQQLLMQQQGADTGAGAPGVTAGQILQGIGGTIGQGTLAGGGGAVAGATQGPGAGYTAGQSAAGGIDALGLIKQALGLGAKVAGVTGGTSGGVGGTQGGYTAGATGGPTGGLIPSTGYSLTGAGAPEAGSPESLAQYFGGQFTGTNLLQDPTFGPLLTQGLLQGSLTPSDLANFATLGGDQLAGLRTALASGNVQSDLGTQLLGGTGGSQGYTLGGAPTPSPTNLGGAVQGGLSGAAGLLNLIQGLQGGNAMQGAGGGIQTIGGLASLLQSSPQLAEALGLGGLGAAGSGLGATSVLGDIGGAAGGLGGLLGILNGIQALQQGNVGAGVQGLGTGGLGVYGGLSTLFPETFPSITGALGSALGATGAETASTIGAGVGAGAGELGAGATAGIVALPLLATVIADMVTNLQDAARMRSSLGDIRRLMSSVPGSVEAITGETPGLLASLGPQATPEQALSVLNQINATQRQFQESGVENLLKTGQATPMFALMEDMPGVKYPAGPEIFRQLQPFFNEENLARVRAEDILGQAGYTPQTIPGYLDPASLFLSMFPGATGAFETAANTVYSGPTTAIPYGTGGAFTDRWGQLTGLQPGGLEQGFAGLLNLYGGGVPSAFQSLGLGTMGQPLAQPLPFMAAPEISPEATKQLQDQIAYMSTPSAWGGTA